MSLPTPAERYRIVISSDCVFRAWREGEPLSHGHEEFDGGIWATREECDAAIEKLWQRRRKFSTGREYTCWGSYCHCTSYRPGYCCAGCKFQASVENDPDRSTVAPVCPCDHSTCGKAVERADPREALAKMLVAPVEAEETGGGSLWDRVKRSWAEAGEERDEWVRDA